MMFDVIADLAIKPSDGIPVHVPTQSGAAGLGGLVRMGQDECP